jgi:hypothetical protein
MTAVDAIATNDRLPLPLKVIYTAFMIVLVPVYWYWYGPTNFLYFCDVSLFLTLAALWLEMPLLASMCAVGLLLPQTLWVVDFILNIFGIQLTGMTDYMFKHENSLFLRALSLFHGWLPFLFAYLVWKLGYDKRGFPAWTVLAWMLMLICFFFMPPPHPNPYIPHHNAPPRYTSYEPYAPYYPHQQEQHGHTPRRQVPPPMPALPASAASATLGTLPPEVDRL